MMNLYGGESLSNLQLEDLEIMGLKMVRYHGKNPFYLAKSWNILTEELEDNRVKI
jgi:hypothetical protein